MIKGRCIKGVKRDLIKKNLVPQQVLHQKKILRFLEHLLIITSNCSEFNLILKIDSNYDIV